ncbi:MAG: ribonuclease Z [Lentimicrobiaceae bacterium]|nr:ribonuclease Z [Lentimicrobiaceae bacterium]
MTFTVRILGSSAALPTSKRNPSTQLLNHKGKLFLIDCAEGTQMQLRRYGIRMLRINHIFISHLHGDHYFGLAGLLFTYHLLGRKDALHIFAKKELEEIIKLQLHVSETVLLYPLVFHAINPAIHYKIYEDELLEVNTIPLIHSIPTCGFLFKEKPLLRKIKKDFLLQETVPVSEFAKIKQGSDYITNEGRIYHNREITIPSAPSLSFAYCSDTAFAEKTADYVRGVNVLYHEATFMSNLSDVARDKMHSTAAQAALVAKKAGTGQLIIGHFSARYEDMQPLLSEAKEIFDNTVVAEDGLEIAIG